ncbi:hypothetical protein RND81_12G172700 [Saponaria officinalis]|uniref:Chromatin assembly factor 1 subunit FAS1 n=1 Tax=Saponaria officinalis TaxID=3572 RepID=A0AAW1HBW5_SAPOF
MGDAMEIDETAMKKSVKRKREKQKLVTPEERESRLKTLNEELCSLIKYFNEVLSVDVGLGLDNFSDISAFSVSGSNASLNAVIAMMLEEKRCSYSKLAGEIYEKLKEKVVGVTVSSVRASVLFVGQRVAYGVHNAEVDVLEDESESCLWCWETRDIKLLPNSLRWTLKIRRICRKKINERITAIQDVISSLQILEDQPSGKHIMSKAADKLNKALSETDIRLLVESLAQKSETEMTGKEATKKGTTLIKELEKNKREVEKEKKRMERELQKEKLQSEKEKKRLQQEAERDEKRREKEESEMRKQLKRKQEEADKEQRRKEKEEAELKKQLAVQKQASIMERFLKKSRIASAPQKDQSAGSATCDAVVNKSENTLKSVSQLMDSALQHTNDIDVDEIRKSHMNSWRILGHSTRSNKQHWGMRRKPKTELIKELKLTTNEEQAHDDDLCVDSLVDGWGEKNTDGKMCNDNTSVSSLGTRRCLWRKQLLQFDKSNRPAFYGIWPKRSSIVKSRHPFAKDPDLDYEIDSDEEWEEEEPGESLSDSEKEEEEILEEGSCKGDDEEESEDGFFVPDGYLSENEGVENDRSQSDVDEDMHTSPGCKPEAESEECSAWTRQQKYLHNLTEHALKKNQPLVIINLMHEKTHLLSADDLSGTFKVEQMCLQALTMRAFPGGLSIELPSNVNSQDENHEASTSNSKGSAAATGIATIPDSDLPKIVSAIQSHPQGINRVLKSLLEKFPGVPKSYLNNKVREISDFVDNRWQVKKEVLDKLGMTTTPERGRVRTKSIATFFSKRCLPPAGKAINLCESSPESVKPRSSLQQ